MTVKKTNFLLENNMTRTQTILGWLYLPVHILLLPVLLRLLAEFSPNPISETKLNLVYYTIGVVFVLCVMLRFLRSNFDALLDRPGYCLSSLILAVGAVYAMNYVVALILLAADVVVEQNPNNEAIMGALDLAAGKEYGMMKATIIFLGPIVEEVLFRGVVFGSIRTKSRFWAYLGSALLFSLYHVWAYALGSGSLTMLLYTLQYIPMSIGFAWAYERSGSLWTSIFLHMGINAVSISVLSLLETL